jgi:hypothetical protein
VPHPAHGLILHLMDRVDQFLREQITVNVLVEALNVDILLWLPG